METHKDRAPVRHPDRPDRVARLRDREGYRLVEFDGQRWHWFFSPYGIRKAEAKGFRPIESLMEMGRRGREAQRRIEALVKARMNGKKPTPEEGADAKEKEPTPEEEVAIEEAIRAEVEEELGTQVSMAALFEGVAGYVYAATAPFYDDVDPDDILLSMTLAEAQRLQRDMTDDLVRLNAPPGAKEDETPAEDKTPTEDETPAEESPLGN